MTRRSVLVVEGGARHSGVTKRTRPPLLEVILLHLLLLDPVKMTSEAGEARTRLDSAVPEAS